MSTTAASQHSAARALLPLNEELHMTRVTIDPFIASACATYDVSSEGSSLHTALETFLLPTLRSVKTTLERGFSHEVIIRKATASIFHALVQASGTLTQGELIGRGQFGTVSVFNAGNLKFAGKRSIAKPDVHQTEQCLLWALDHERVIPIWGVNNEGVLFLPLAQGDLSSYLPTLTEERLRIIVRQCLESIAYLQRKGVVHRDIKTENLLVVNGQLVLSDFGLGSLVQRVQGIAGSPMYMAPEAISGRGDQSMVDMWSFAATVAEVATQGQSHLFRAKDIRAYISRTNRRPLSQRAATASIDRLGQDVRVQTLDPDGRILAILRRVLIVDPRRRPSAQTVLSEHAGVLTGQDNDLITSRIAASVYASCASEESIAPADQTHYSQVMALFAGVRVAPAFSDTQIDFAIHAPGFVAMNINGREDPLPVTAKLFAEYIDSLTAEMLNSYLHNLLALLVEARTFSGYDITPKTVMIIDGQAHLTKATGRKEDVPLEYLPPEDFKDEQGRDETKRRMWQLGALLYSALTGEPLIQYETYGDALENSPQVELRLALIDGQHERSDRLDPEHKIRDLLDKLLHKEPPARLTPEEALLTLDIR